MKALVGIDLGTSSVCSMVMTVRGKILAVASESYPVNIPQPQYAEQDPEQWYQATVSTLRTALSQSGISPKNIMTVGVTGQMHGLVALNKDGNPVRPAMVWQDRRSEKTIREMYRKLGDSYIASQVQNRVSPGFLLASLLWLKENEPESYQRTRMVLPPKDYIKYRLCGQLVTDPSDAAGTLAYNNINGEWAKPLLQELGINPSLFPPIEPSATIIGTISGAASLQTRLSTATRVANGGADQALQAVGNGVLSPGVFACNIGTGGQISTTIDAPIVDPARRTLTLAHAVPKRWNLMGTTLNAGSAFDWYADDVLQTQDYKALDHHAETLPPGGGGLLFLPYLLGERTPHLHPRARGVFFGLKNEHSRYHLARAVMEGVAFSLKDCMLLITDTLEVPCTRIVAAGGGARSAVWLQILADVFDREIETNPVKEQACMGAAMTAGVASRLYSGFDDAVEKLVEYDRHLYVPQPQAVEVYGELYPIFEELYLRNQDLMNQLAAF